LADGGLVDLRGSFALGSLFPKLQLVQLCLRPGVALVDLDRPFEGVPGVLKVTGTAERTPEVVVLVGPIRVGFDCFFKRLSGLSPFLFSEVHEAKLIVAVRYFGVCRDGLFKQLSRLVAG